MTVTEPRTTVEVQPQAGYIGAEIRGVDLSRPLDPVTRDEIEAALHSWKVLFFRDQELDHASHLALARQFGGVTRSHPYAPPRDEDQYPQIGTIDIHQGGSYGYGPEHEKPWHSDLTSLINPPAVAFLRAEEVPPYGGDTQWTNLVAAYDGLAEPVRELAEKLRALHTFEVPVASGLHRTGDNSTFQERIRSNPSVTEHPVVRVHPVTGERALFVNPAFTRAIVGVSAAESRHLLGLFFEEIGRAEYTVRFKWEPGSLAVWDNRSTAHRIPGDVHHLGFRRVLHRITTEGDVPVGVDGTPSTSLSGEPFLAI